MFKASLVKEEKLLYFLLQSILPNQLFLIKQYTKLFWSDCEFLHGAQVLSIIDISIYISLAFRLYCYKKCAGLDCWGGPYARFTYYILLIVYTEELLSNVCVLKYTCIHDTLDSLPQFWSRWHDSSQHITCNTSKVWLYSPHPQS